MGQEGGEMSVLRETNEETGCDVAVMPWPDYEQMEKRIADENFVGALNRALLEQNADLVKERNEQQAEIDRLKAEVAHWKALAEARYHLNNGLREALADLSDRLQGESTNE
jgi:8-oxo-dGTP pyrophosphatase MutT (NUDIX family)